MYSSRSFYVFQGLLSINLEIFALISHRFSFEYLGFPFFKFDMDTARKRLFRRCVTANSYLFFTFHTYVSYAVRVAVYPKVKLVLRLHCSWNQSNHMLDIVRIEKLQGYQNVEEHE